MPGQRVVRRVEPPQGLVVVVPGVAKQGQHAREVLDHVASGDQLGGHVPARRRGAPRAERRPGSSGAPWSRARPAARRRRAGVTQPRRLRQVDRDLAHPSHSAMTTTSARPTSRAPTDAIRASATALVMRAARLALPPLDCLRWTRRSPIPCAVRSWAGATASWVAWPGAAWPPCTRPGTNVSNVRSQLRSSIRTTSSTPRVARAGWPTRRRPSPGWRTRTSSPCTTRAPTTARRTW